MVYGTKYHIKNNNAITNFSSNLKSECHDLNTNE